ncbi:hypothetical protein ACFSJI_24100, partial [Streptomyces calvus]|uniref:hypothetical protein n=1 Tax=Streptomyces calvus TaxID=67282 RepID=UPI003643E8B8
MPESVVEGPASAVGASGLVSPTAAWLAEPSAAVRARRGAVADGVPSSPATAWLAEPSAAERVRRTGRAPAGRAARVGRS